MWQERYCGEGVCQMFSISLQMMALRPEGDAGLLKGGAPRPAHIGEHMLSVVDGHVVACTCSSM